MSNVYFAKQRIFTRNNNIFAHELLFRDNQYGIKNFPTNIKATSHVLINVLLNIHEVLDETNVVLINVDEDFLLSGMVDLLDKKKFMLEILETTDLNDKVISRIKQYHKRGFKFAIDDFDCSAAMIKQFNPVFKYVHLIKIDVIESEAKNIRTMVARFKKSGLKTLAEKVETKEEYESYLDMGFDLFQGYYLHKPQTVEVKRGKDLTQFIILNLIKMIKNDADTKALEKYIKQRSELSLKLIQFLNAQGNFDGEIESIVQVITLLGRDKLLRWLLLYLYSEISDEPISKIILAIACNRATMMESLALEKDKDKAYLAGMFSMIGALFDMSNKEVIKDIKLDSDITDLIVRKKGKFLSGLLKAEQKEHVYLKKLCADNFQKIDPLDILYTLEMNGVDIDISQL